jgi:tetratricopeptide (TPR) repeat protein
MMSQRSRRARQKSFLRTGSACRPSTRVEDLAEAIIEAGWLAALVVIPLFFNPYTARSYEPDKTVLMRAIVLVMSLAWLWKVLSGGRAWRPTGIDRDSEQGRGDVGQQRNLLRALAHRPILGLAAVLALLLVIGAVTSIDPRLSWLGSYTRFQGAWAQLSYLAFFGLTAAHLRTLSQWRRAVYTMILGSVPVSLYAVLQPIGLDPVPHGIEIQRAFSTLGNPIFLGAYLLMVSFISLEEVRRAAVVVVGERCARSAASLLTLSAILVLQLTALVLTQSRGPFLGWLAGAYVFFLLSTLLIQARISRGSSSLSLAQRLAKWSWAMVVAAGVAIAAFLVTFNLPGSPLEALRSVPYVGRLGSILDLESNTVQVRFLIWDSTLEVLADNEPLAGPGDQHDRLAAMRKIIGYGPETLALAVNRHIRPELGQREGRSDLPDRAHNETLDVLVTQGVLGYGIWLALYCLALLMVLRRLGLVRSRPQRLSFWVNLTLGAALGALGPFLFYGRWTLVGVGLPTGLIVGFLVVVTLEALVGGRSSLARVPVRESGLLVAVLATLVAHFVEIHFGIAIVTTRLYFWFFLAVLVASGEGWLAFEERRGPEDDDGPDRRGSEIRSTSGQLGLEAGSREGRTGLIAGMLCWLVCIPVSYALILDPEGSSTALAVVAAALRPATSGEGSATGALPLLLLTCWVVSAVLAADLYPSKRVGRPWRRESVAVLIGICGTVGYALLHSGLLARAVRLRLAGAEPLDQVLAASELLSMFFWAVLFMILVLGVACSWRRGDLRSWSRTSGWRAAIVFALLAVSSIWIVDANLDALRADTLLKQARAFIASGRPRPAIPLLDRASELAPREPMFFLYRGQAAMQAATSAAETAVRETWLAEAEKALSRARVLAPLDPDHSANLGRHAVRSSATVDEPKERERLLRRAEEEYRAALALRPDSVLLINELTPVLIRLGKLEEAEKLLNRARALDDRYARTFFNLASLDQTRAAKEGRMGDLSAFSESCRRAIENYERALDLEPGLESARRQIERLRRALDRISGASASADRDRVSRFAGPGRVSEEEPEPD